MDGTKTLLGIPTYDGIVHLGVGEHPLVQDGDQRNDEVLKAWATSSLIPKTFGLLWTQAVMMGEREGFTHFAMQHADVVAQRGWLNILHTEMERLNCDLISVLVPIKDGSGLTSTGIDVQREPIKFRRISMREAATLPETFGIEDTKHPDGTLVVNTGLWLARLNRPWNKRVSFQGVSWVFYYTDGTNSRISVEPEDWNMSRTLWMQGVKCYCTRKVQAKHMDGRVAYENQGAWGSIFYEDAERCRTMVKGYEGDYYLPPGAYVQGDEDFPADELPAPQPQSAEAA